ncbi:MAG: TIGR02147 family protein [Fibrobacteraceae bacterium]|nr:TIGR02147 family protein [Fibrobacteraceae bacterium]
MKSVIEYEDYRLFMSEYYQWKKRTSAFTWREFTKKGGFTSPNYMKLVCEGKSGLSKSGMEGAADAMDLVGAEREYFRQLVKFCQAKRDADKKVAYAEMKAIAAAHKVRVLEGESASFYESWKYPVLRELAPMMPGAKPLEVAKACGGAFTAEEVRDALAFLTRAKFLKKNADGTYEQIERSLMMSTAAMPMLVRSMHKEMARFAEDAVEKFAVDERNFTGVTMGIDDESYAQILHELDLCRKRIISIATAKKGGNRVYRLNMQMFPLTDKV